MPLLATERNDLLFSFNFTVDQRRCARTPRWVVGPPRSGTSQTKRDARRWWRHENAESVPRVVADSSMSSTTVKAKKNAAPACRVPRMRTDWRCTRLDGSGYPPGSVPPTGGPLEIKIKRGTKKKAAGMAAQQHEKTKKKKKKRKGNEEKKERATRKVGRSEGNRMKNRRERTVAGAARCTTSAAAIFYRIHWKTGSFFFSIQKISFQVLSRSHFQGLCHRIHPESHSTGLSSPSYRLNIFTWFS